MTDVELPPGQRVHRDHPRFGLPWYAHRSPRALESVSVELVGPSGARAVLTDADIGALEHRTQRSDFHCVTTWSRLGIHWAGVPFQVVYDEVVRPRVDPDGSARFLTFVGRDGYKDETCMADLRAADVLLVTEMNGRPLTLRHGGPLRLVAPAHYGYKSVKYLTRIELQHGTRHRMPWSIHHPRGRVAYEERILGLPDRLIKLFYQRFVLPPTLWWYRRHPRD